MSTQFLGVSVSCIQQSSPNTFSSCSFINDHALYLDDSIAALEDNAQLSGGPAEARDENVGSRFR